MSIQDTKELIEGALGKKSSKPVFQSALDMADDKEKEQAKLQAKNEEKTGSAFDMADFSSAKMDMDVAALVQEFANTTTDDLDEGEGLGDRLFGLLAGVVDEDMDGELSDEESELLEMAINTAGDYLSAKGIADEDILALFADFDNDIAESIQNQLVIPEGDEAEEEIEEFAFGDGADESALDATYKKRLKIRKGKKVWVNTRIAGKVRRSSKQKMAQKRASKKGQTGKAKMRRAKSNRLRKNMNLKSYAKK